MSGIKRAEPTIAKKVYLPQSLSVKCDQLLVDDMRGRPKYGAFSQLVTKLLNEYFARLAASRVSPQPKPQEQDDLLK